MPGTIVIYHKADYDGIFCREIARKFIPHATLVGWDYGESDAIIPPGTDRIYMLDISVDSWMKDSRVIWIDHHKSAIDKYGKLAGYQIDGVAACRLAWQYFANNTELPTKQQFIDREVKEPLAVRLAGEYDIWDKRDSRTDRFQYGLASMELGPTQWTLLLNDNSLGFVDTLLERGSAVEYAKTTENASVINSIGFDVEFEGLKFLACNAAHYNSHLFTAAVKPEHDGLLGFKYTGKDWSVSLYGAPGKPSIDLSTIAVKYGGGGHRQACGFKVASLPFLNK